VFRSEFSKGRTTMSVEREGKHIKRMLRTIPIEAIASVIAEEEAGMQALICLVNDLPEFVRSEGNPGQTTWDCDPLEYAQIVRWLRAHPERVHPTYESAKAFVQTQISN
jgi:hypothetical protein